MIELTENNEKTKILVNTNRITAIKETDHYKNNYTKIYMSGSLPGDNGYITVQETISEIIKKMESK